MEQDAELFGDYAVEVIGEKWDVQDLRSVASAELLVTSTDEQKASWLKQRQGEAGAFVKIKNRKATLRASEDLAGKASLAAFYAAEVEFEKGERRVVLRLQKREIGDWQVVSVSVGPAAGLGKEADTKS